MLSIKDIDKELDNLKNDLLKKVEDITSKFVDVKIIDKETVPSYKVKAYEVKLKKAKEAKKSKDYSLFSEEAELRGLDPKQLVNIIIKKGANSVVLLTEDEIFLLDKFRIKTTLTIKNSETFEPLLEIQKLLVRYEDPFNIYYDIIIKPKEEEKMKEEYSKEEEIYEPIKDEEIIIPDDLKDPLEDNKKNDKE